MSTAKCLSLASAMSIARTLTFGSFVVLQAREALNAMFREYEEDKTFNHMKENWFNGTSPCVELEERGEGTMLLLADVWVFFFVLAVTGLAAVLAQLIIDSLVQSDPERERERER